MIKVVVADDEALIRAGVSTVLESASDITVAAATEDGREAVAEAIRHGADVALLDIKMPTMDGLAAAAELNRRLPALRAVLLTSFGEQSNVVRALRHGVAGFLLKNSTPDELIRAVRAAHSGAAFLSPEVTRMVLGMVTPEDELRRNRARNRLARLSPRERDIIRLVAEGLSNAEICMRLSMAEVTIKTYVSRILTKVDCANRVQAALLVRDAGEA